MHVKTLLTTDSASTSADGGIVAYIEAERTDGTGAQTDACVVECAGVVERNACMAVEGPHTGVIAVKGAYVGVATIRRFASASALVRAVATASLKLVCATTCLPTTVGFWCIGSAFARISVVLVFLGFFKSLAKAAFADARAGEAGAGAGSGGAGYACFE